MIFFVNLFFDYDQIFLIKTFQNLIVFQISIDLMRMIILFQKIINFVTQFVKIIIWILINHISRVTFFFDDISVKELQNIFENYKKILFKIRKKVFEHIQWLNEILTDFKKADCIIFEKKSQFCCIDIRIVEFICDDDKKHPNTVKIIKIVKWSICTNVAEAREFIEMCVYYRIFIEKFVIIFVSIYKLLKKNVIFDWKSKQQEIINILKMKFINSSIFIILDYNFKKEIILAANVSLKNWKKVFMQIKNKKQHFCKYENDMWNVIEAKYDAIKRECREILKNFKKFRYYLYDVHFILKIDVKVLIA